jgi:hypothetical protein
VWLAVAAKIAAVPAAVTEHYQLIVTIKGQKKELLVNSALVRIMVLQLLDCPYGMLFMRHIVSQN